MLSRNESRRVTEARRMLTARFVTVVAGVACWIGACTESTAPSSEDFRADSCGLAREAFALSPSHSCSVGGAGGAKNPCDPGCRIFEEEPPSALRLDDAASWQSGRASSLDFETRSQAWGTCETGADCQFNSKCLDPAVGTCEHSVCAAGDGLRNACNDCASLVCASDASCCDTEPALDSCRHNLCTQGVPLDASCDTCATSICSSPGLSHCCEATGRWDQSCVDAVQSTCGQTCGCGPGEQAFNGRCYSHSANGKSWQNALRDCRGRGAGWDLVSLEDAAEKDFVESLDQGEELWLGLFDSAGASTSSFMTVSASGERPGNGPGFALDGNPNTSWTVENRLASSPEISASESQSGHEPGDAVDGDTGTYWAAQSANTSDGKELTLVFASPVTIEDVSIRWKDGNARSFDFELLAGSSTSALSVLRARGGSTILGAPGAENYDVPDTLASVLRVVSYGNSSNLWNSIEELSVGSSPATIHTTERLPEWIDLKLPGERLIEGVYVEFDDDDTSFDILVGQDEESLAVLYTGDNGSNTGLMFIDTPDTLGQLVRVRVWGNSSDRWNNLARFALLAPAPSVETWEWSSGATAGYTNWSSAWLSSPVSSADCVRSESPGGEWRGEDCDEASNYVCEGPPGFMGAASGTWSDSCVSLATDLCHVSCDDASSGAGSCVAWQPGEVDPECAGVDLALGIPCDGNLLVCNHGSTAAPAGIDVVHFDSSAGLFGSTANSGSHASAATCTTAEPIPAGECITLSGCMPSSIGRRDVIVNPDATVTECSQMDNWAIYDETVACEAPTCGGSTVNARQSQVDIIFFVDNSSSMEDEIDEIEARLSSDFADIIEASGLDYRVIMISRMGRQGESVVGSYFPLCIGPPLGNDACTDTGVSFSLTPPYYPYSNDSESEDAWCDILASFSHPDELVPEAEVRPWRALSPQGWSQWLRPDAQKAFVVITDDEVKCSIAGKSWRDRSDDTAGEAVADAFDAELLALSPEQFGTASDRKYVWHSIVGMSAPSTGLDASQSIRESTCGGGSDAPGTGYQALSIKTGGLRFPICDSSSFDYFFTELAQAVVDDAETDCVYPLPALDSFDPGDSKVTVLSRDSASHAESQVELGQVASLVSCDAQSYYFDDAVAPANIILCPTACDAFQPVSGSEIEVLVELACPMPEPQAFVELYQADCPDSKQPFWTFVTYDSEVSGDGEIEVSVRTGQDATDLGIATFSSVRTIDSSQPSCGLGCGVSLDTALDSSAWNDEFLELSFLISPSSSGESPVLRDWGVWYTCQDFE